jgi:hypothetical protein
VPTRATLPPATCALLFFLFLRVRFAISVSI